MSYFWYDDVLNQHGEHNVHKSACRYMPSMNHASYVGQFDLSFQVIELLRRKERFKRFNGCKFCMPSEHIPHK
ncbi:TPA: hypothetical protein U3L57_000105 [Streptococcus agalactiae]|nr:hypothetical protein [Streptococcus agalactiae]